MHKELMKYQNTEKVETVTEGKRKSREQET
jgi:hypothetical protein